MSASLSKNEKAAARSLLRLSEGWGNDHPGVLERLFAMVSDLVVVTSRSGEILLINPAWKETLGWSEEELLGRSVFELVAPEDRKLTAQISTSDPVVNFTNRYRHKDGSWRWLLWSGRTDGDVWYAVAKDVTERLTLERRALYDDLTGVANRALLLDHLRGALARLGRAEDQLVAVLFVDVDSFKLVNDGYGHDAGDQVLVEVARRLRSSVRETDMIGRLGGDEFVVVAEGVSNEAEAALVGERVLKALSEEYALGGQQITLGCSIGIATTRDPGSDPDGVVRDADIAMYRSKAHGGGTAKIFDARAKLEVAERVQIERELRRAVREGELTVHYQPVVAVDDGTLAGCEALVRWEHPEQGRMLPDRFIPLAEATGLIVGLGEFVLLEACRQAGRWRREGSDFTVSVNVSRRQLLEPGFVETVRTALRSGGVPGQSICLEVTETAAPARDSRIVEVLQAVRALGIKIALDDFGAGYSTLTNLRELPIDVIKIDRTFVAGITEAGDDRGIVAAVMALARELGLTVIAEGVERPEQLATLRAMGCQFAQGHLFAAAGDADALLAGGFNRAPQQGIGDPFVGPLASTGGELWSAGARLLLLCHLG